MSLQRLPRYTETALLLANLRHLFAFQGADHERVRQQANRYKSISLAVRMLLQYCHYLTHQSMADTTWQEHHRKIWNNMRALWLYPATTNPQRAIVVVVGFGVAAGYSFSTPALYPKCNCFAAKRVIRWQEMLEKIPF